MKFQVLTAIPWQQIQVYVCCDRELDPTLYFQFVLACFLPIRAYSADHYSLETTSYNIQKPRLPRPDDLRERLSSSEREKCEQNVLNILIPTYDFSQHIGGFSALLFGRRPIKFVYHLR